MSRGGCAARRLLLLALLLACPAGLARAIPGDPSGPTAPPPAEAVVSVGMTVGDMDRSVRFFSEVLEFEKVSDAEVTGEDLERLEGLFGLRMRVVQQLRNQRNVGRHGTLPKGFDSARANGGVRAGGDRTLHGDDLDGQAV